MNGYIVESLNGYIELTVSSPSWSQRFTFHVSTIQPFNIHLAAIHDLTV